MKAQAQAAFGPNSIRKYMLHFDINKTIVLQDTENGMNKEQTIQEHLVNMAWGKIDEKNPNQWKVMHNVFTKIQPQPGLLTYQEFVDYQYPLKSGEEEPDAAVREKFNQEQQEIKQEALNNFIKVAGPKLKNDIDRITKHLSLNKVILEELKLPRVPSEIHADENPLLHNFYDGKYFILPNFYRMMTSLKKSKKEFAIIFRAFGDELNQVITEFNKFCAGEHPCYNGKNNTPLARFDGSKGTKNFIIQIEDLITLYRFNEKLEGMQAAFGTLKRKNIDRNNQNINLEEYYQNEIQSEEGEVVIEKEGGNIQLRIRELLKKSCALAISEDRDYYINSGKQENSGKPLLIDQADYSTLQIFFDDEIYEDEPSIVTVHDYITREIIPIKRSLNKYVVKVDTIALIKDPDYFIKAIDACEKARQEEIDRIEKGITDEVQIDLKKSEWELLNELNDGDYLKRTILPLLHPALKLINVQRPADPISFIAFYLLKNKEKVKIPIPPQEIIENQQKDEEEPQKQQEVEQPPVIDNEQKPPQQQENKPNEKQQQKK